MLWRSNTYIWVASYSRIRDELFEDKLIIRYFEDLLPIFE